MTRAMRHWPWVATFGAVVILAPDGELVAGRQQNPIAVFSALDKVTARISRLEIPIDQTAEFGALKITPRVCYTREPTEPPNTTSFVEVDEIKLDKTEERIFAGWMFAESPGINGVEHSVFDVWLTGCATQFQPVADNRPRETLLAVKSEEGMPLPVRKSFPGESIEDAESSADQATPRRRRTLR
ncbi:MAG: DUF2155 domain-containing protein [Rhizobiales bacterium]|nr:DUF2155 domain-containing protein [Hyphomicrobiales bacterium]